jgi:hypothetical protein
MFTAIITCFSAASSSAQRGAGPTFRRRVREDLAKQREEVVLAVDSAIASAAGVVRWAASGAVEWPASLAPSLSCSKPPSGMDSANASRSMQVRSVRDSIVIGDEDRWATEIGHLVPVDEPASAPVARFLRVWERRSNRWAPLAICVYNVPRPLSSGR